MMVSGIGELIFKFSPESRHYGPKYRKFKQTPKNRVSIHSRITMEGDYAKK